MREVEVLVEKETVCRTPKSTCLNKFRNSRVDAFLLGKTMRSVQQDMWRRARFLRGSATLRERMDQLHEYARKKVLSSRFGICPGLLEGQTAGSNTYERKLSSSLPECTIPSEGFYELTEVTV